MANGVSFWRQVLREAVRSYYRYLKDSREHVIGFVVTTTIVFAVLFWAPGLGDWRAEMGATAALVAAILATAALRFLIELAAAPGRVHSRATSRVRELETILGRETDIAAAQAEIFELYWEGRRLYEDEGDYAVWSGDTPNDWMSRARAAVERHYDASVLFYYDTHYGTAKIVNKRGINYPEDAPDLRPVLQEVLRTLDALESVSIYPPSADRLRQVYPTLAGPSGEDRP